MPDAVQKVTKKEFIDMAENHPSYFLGVAHKIPSYDQMMTVVKSNIENPQPELLRYGKKYSNGVKFTTKEGDCSVVSIMDDDYNKRTVYKLADTALYIVEDIGIDSYGDTWGRYMFYLFV